MQIRCDNTSEYINSEYINKAREKNKKPLPSLGASVGTRIKE
jgi:hypothetical protein